MNKSFKYKKVASYEADKKQIKNCLLLYSGGLDTSIILKWIQDSYKIDVTTLTIDIGQQKDNLEEIKKKALKLGAKKAFVINAKEEFANEYISKGIKANGSYQGDYYLSTPMGRALISKKAADIAKVYNIDAIAHGCTGKGNDQIRFDSYLLTHFPGIKIIAPVREWNMDRKEQLEYANLHKIPVSASNKMPYSIDDNMWGITWEGGEIEEPSLIPHTQNFIYSVLNAKKTPAKEKIITITFNHGIPEKINGKKTSLAALIEVLNMLGNEYHIGTSNVLEDRVTGLKSRGVYHHPGAHIIIKAHKALEQYVSTRTLNEIKDFMDTKWSYYCYEGKWYDPAFEAINSFNDTVNAKVCGEVTMNLKLHHVDVVALESPFGLPHASFSTSKHNDFNVNASAGFIEMSSYQMRKAYNIAKNIHVKNQLFYE